MATAAVDYFKQNHPDANVSLLGLPSTLSVFENSSYSYELIPYDREAEHFGWSGLLRLASQLRNRKFDCGYLLTNSFSSALIFWLARIPKRIGYSGQLRNAMLSQQIKPLPGEVHQTERYAHLLLNEIPNDLQIGITVSSEEESCADEILSKHNINPNRLIGMAIGAAYGPAKRWLPERFGELAKQCEDELEARSMLLGSKHEKMLAIKAMKHAGKGTVDLTAKTSLRELYALLQKCNVVVTNDSGLMHAAAAVGAPVAAIFGPTRPGETAPYTKNYQIIKKDLACAPCMKRKCPLKHHDCMRQIEVDEVFDLIKGYFNYSPS